MKYNIESVLGRKLPYLRECVSLRFSLSVCAHAYLFFYSWHMFLLSIGTWISSLYFAYHSENTHQSAFIWHVYSGWCYYQMLCIFALAIVKHLWAQLRQRRKLNERGWFMYTMARHLHEIPINLGDRHLGPRTSFIWDCHGHDIYSGGKKKRSSCS